MQVSLLSFPEAVKFSFSEAVKPEQDRSGCLQACPMHCIVFNRVTPFQPRVESGCVVSLQAGLPTRYHLDEAMEPCSSHSHLCWDVP